MRLVDLPLDLLRLCLQNLSILDVAIFDLSILNREYRSTFLFALKGLELLEMNFYLTSELMQWLMRRGVLVRNIPLAIENSNLFDLIEYSRETLRSINLSHSRISDDLLLAFLTNCPRLTSIDLRSCPRLTDQGIQSFLAHKSNLRHLNLAGCDRLTAVSIQAIAESCPELQELNLSCLQSVTDTEVAQVISGCRHLLKLNLSSTAITADSVTAVINAYPGLLSLNILRCPRVAGRGILLMRSLYYRQIMSPDPVLQLNGTLQLSFACSTGPSSCST
jgi:hypothetical protein